MQISGLPIRMPVPFADTGTKNTIPQTSQVGITAGLASYPTGFPPLTMTPVAAGGVPPLGADFNGILNAITTAIRWANAGMGYPFDAAFASSVSGYPKGALLPNSAFTGYWLNTVDGNSTAPEAADASTTGWVPMLGYGSTAVTLTSSSVTLTSLQASKRRIVLSGALTANVTLYFPAWVGEWTVVNNCTGAYSVTLSTPSGTGVSIPGGSVYEIYGDGTNIVFKLNAKASGLQRFTASGSFTVPAGVTTVYLSGCGGGGGGGGGAGFSSSASSYYAGGGGGGGGGFSVVRYPVSVTPGQVIAVTIGAAGTAGASGAAGASGGAGGTGGATNFGSLATLGGGSAGAGGTGGSATAAGGQGANIGGSWGSDGQSTFGGTGGSGGGGAFGAGGGAGRGGLGAGISAVNGSGFGTGGGGGGGCYSNSGIGGSGSAGMPGYLIVEW